MVKELEVKILNIDIEELEKNLINLGAQIISKEEQENITIDSSNNPLNNYLKGYLRIRISKDLLSGKISQTFTLKEQLENLELRENIEHNIEVEDGIELLKVLEKIGYDKIHRGFKSRVSYKLQDARFDIDTWDKETYPYPYAEIEVSKEEDLQKYLKLLKIPEESVSKLSISELREKLLKE